MIRNIILLLALVEGGWLTFDGVRALTVGDYVTASSGPYAGRLGPWSKVVAAVGIAPRSTFMKSMHVAFGLGLLLSAAGFYVRASWGWQALLVSTIATAWYLPIGTIVSVIQIILLLLPSLKR